MSTCPYLNLSRCKLVEELTNKECQVTRNICLACENSDRPQRINLVTITLASRLTPEREYPIDMLGNGFGTQLANLFKHLSLSEVKGCECPGHQDLLDLWTPEYIRSNIDLVVKWLGKESRKRRIPFLPFLAKRILLRLLSYYESGHEASLPQSQKPDAQAAIQDPNNP